MGDPTKDGGSTATLQISNNVLYNWGYNTCYGGGYAYTNYINNYLKAGIGTRETVFNQLIDMGESTKPGGFYVNGNYMEGNAAVTADNSKGEKMSGATSGANKTEVANKPYTAEGFASATVVDAKDCYESVLKKAGATYPYRDAIDARVVAETRNDTGRYINSQKMKLAVILHRRFQEQRILILIWMVFQIHGRRHMDLILMMQQIQKKNKSVNGICLC